MRILFALILLLVVITNAFHRLPGIVSLSSLKLIARTNNGKTRKKTESIPDWDGMNAYFNVSRQGSQDEKIAGVSSVPRKKLASWKDDIYSRDARLRGKVSQQLHDIENTKKRTDDTAETLQKAKRVN